ncbi:hypothetical protein ACTXT7_000278 [Hymenolepis weldensis]
MTLSELVDEDDFGLIELFTSTGDAEIDPEELNTLPRKWISSVMGSIKRCKDILLSIFNLEGENCTLNSLQNTLLNGDEHIYGELCEEFERLNFRVQELLGGQISPQIIMEESPIEFAQLPPAMREFEDLMALILMEAGLEPRFTPPIDIPLDTTTPDGFVKVHTSPSPSPNPLSLPSVFIKALQPAISLLPLLLCDEDQKKLKLC